MHLLSMCLIQDRVLAFLHWDPGYVISLMMNLLALPASFSHHHTEVQFCHRSISPFQHTVNMQFKPKTFQHRSFDSI